MKETENKLTQLISYTKIFHNYVLEQYSNNDVDILFIILSHKEFINTLTTKLTINPNLPSEEIKELIYTFDEVISIWREGLSHYIPTESNKKNDLYSVFFAISMAIYNIVQHKEETEECIEAN